MKYVLLVVMITLSSCADKRGKNSATPPFSSSLSNRAHSTATIELQQINDSTSPIKKDEVVTLSVELTPEESAALNSLAILN